MKLTVINSTGACCFHKIYEAQIGEVISNFEINAGEGTRRVEILSNEGRLDQVKSLLADEIQQHQVSVWEIDITKVT